MYEKLLLVNGGGVSGEAQKGTQAPNTVNIIIGLGGTGKFCVRMVKTYAYQRLKFSANDINGEFRHIRFLAVDTDLNNEQQEEEGKFVSLSRNELINIEQPDLLAQLPHAAWNAWFWNDENANGINTGTGHGAGGERQLGRLYLNNSTEGILNKISNIYNIATQGVTVTPGAGTPAASINFHIISGMGGGTGSGTFLDMCYLLKHSYPGANLIGYFFLPEVNEDVVAERSIKTYIRQNGFAAMQDLDYAMQLGMNHGGFDQVYNGLAQPVKWSSDPVDLCHIISNQGGTGLGQGREKYSYAMNVVAEYIMDFLVESNNTTHNLISEINNKNSKVNIRKGERTSGYCCNYSSMGSACAVVPYREINTYVISKLFSKFSEIFNESGADMPSAKDCFNILKQAFAPNANTFEDLNKGLYIKAASGVNVGAYNPYQDSLKELNWNDIVTDDKDLSQLRSTDILLPRQLHNWYFTSQYVNKLGKMKTNMSSLSNEGNAESLIGAITAQLLFAAKNINRGPLFALRAIDAAAEKSLVDWINGLIKANEESRDNAFDNLLRLSGEYNNCVKLMQKKKFKKKYVEATENAIISFFAQLGSVDIYDQIVDLLNKLKTQLTGDTKTYFTRLNTAYNELKARFETNLKDIETNNNDSKVADEYYADYLITLNQLKTSLDVELLKAVPNIPQTFENFMSWITDENKKELLSPDNQNAFIKHVNAFFIDDNNGVFNGLIKMKIDDYLRMAYASDHNIADWSNVTNAEVQGYVQNEIAELIKKAQPLVTMNGSIQSLNGNPSGWITIPSNSQAIAAAANAANMTNLSISDSDLSDRIFVETRYDGVSLSAMTRVGEMEATADQVSTRHLYSGSPRIQHVFNDWGKLPPLTPYQKWNHLNQNLSHADNYARVFDEAVECGLIQPVRNNGAQAGNDYIDGIEIRKFDEESLNSLATDTAALKERAEMANSVEFRSSRAAFDAELNSLKAQLDDMFELTTVLKESFQTSSQDPANDPTGVEHRKAFYKDMFVRAPQLVMDVEEQLSHTDDYNKVMAEIAECEALFERKQNEGEINNRLLPVFEYALYTGLFTINGNNITCDCKDSRTGRELISEPLAAQGEKFPYARIPIYQAFLTFRNLDADVIEKVRVLADERANEMFNPGSVIDDNVQNFMGRMPTWYRLADQQDNANEIIGFLENESEQFAIFKEERGL